MTIRSSQKIPLVCFFHYATLFLMSFMKATATVGGLTMLSRVFGFIRDILTAALLGAGPVADAFFVALKLPNLFRRMTAEGAFSVSFVPIYSRELAENGQEEAAVFAGRALSVMLTFLVPFTIIMIAAMPWVLYLIAPGFDEDPVRYDTALTLSRITFPYLLLMSVSALLGGLLNAHDRFAPFAAAPIFFNLSLITLLLFGTPFLPTAGHALAFGVALAGIVQLAWLFIWVKRLGLMFCLQKPKLAPRIRRLFRLMGPGVFGAGVIQINILVDVILASLLPVGAVSYLYYADRLHQLPMGVIATAVGTALLPKLTRAIAIKNHRETESLFSRALEISLLLALPAAVALVLMPVPIVDVLFERGAFGATETRATAMAIAAYALGLPAFTVTKVLATTCYANEDTVTPVKVGIVSALTNIILSYALIHVLAHVGIALATSCAAWVQFLLLAVLSGRKYGLSPDSQFKNRLPRILISCVGMGIALVLLQRLLTPWLASESLWIQIPVFIGLVSSGFVVYAALTLFSGAVSKDEITSMIKRK